MKVKLCKECASYLNEDEESYWCSSCGYEEFKEIKVRYVLDD